MTGDRARSRQALSATAAQQRGGLCAASEPAPTGGAAGLGLLFTHGPGQVLCAEPCAPAFLFLSFPVHFPRWNVSSARWELHAFCHPEAGRRRHS